MKVTSLKPKGQRILKSQKALHNSLGKTSYCKRPFWIEPTDNSWWFNLDTNQWTQESGGNFRKTSAYYSMKFHGLKDVYSLKSVIRLISKWDVPKGTQFTASLPFVGYEFKITK